MNTERTVKYLLYISWIIALGGLLGSLYFSEIAGYAPCILCWYQRICLYPLALIIPIGLLGRDKRLPLYVLPLSSIGLLISIFHNLLYWGIIPEAAGPCQIGVSCITKYIEWLGFITIPFLSFLSFAFITGAMIAVYKLEKARHE